MTDKLSYEAQSLILQLHKRCEESNHDTAAYIRLPDHEGQIAPDPVLDELIASGYLVQPHENDPEILHTTKKRFVAEGKNG